MTDTIDLTEHTVVGGEQVYPGDLCWVHTATSAPLDWRNKDRVMAVYCGSRGQRQWILLLPRDEDRDSTYGGWRLATHVTNGELDRLNLRRFENSHNGWWPTPSGITPFEKCLGYWCVTHQVFHAAETCPPSDEPDRFVETARIAQLEMDLAEARRANEVLVREHEAFVTKASEILGEEADSHDLCEVYDRIAERAGLRRRVREHEVTIEVTYRQVIQVHARSAGAAEEDTREAEIESGWHPTVPLEMDVEGASTPTDVAVKVIVEPPF